MIILVTGIILLLKQFSQCKKRKCLNTDIKKKKKKKLKEVLFISTFKLSKLFRRCLLAKYWQLSLIGKLESGIGKIYLAVPSFRDSYEKIVNFLKEKKISTIFPRPFITRKQCNTNINSFNWGFSKDKASYTIFTSNLKAKKMNTFSPYPSL